MNALALIILSAIPYFQRMEIPVERDIPVHWSIWSRLLFRFFGLFLVLTNLSWILSFVGLGSTYNELLEGPVVWVARKWMGAVHDFPIQPNGSGDRTYDFAMFFLYAALALFGTVIWSLADRKRSNDDLLHEWLRVFLRYVLSMTMMGYGLIKVFWLQMQFPSLTRLLQPYGDSSPMGLAWTFMGFSQGYAMFTGGMELIGGLLLLWRRTTLLGSLILLGVVINIVFVNFCFDVPVKLYSVQLTLLTLFLLTPDIRRLWDSLIMRRSVPAQTFKPHFQDPVVNKVFFWIKHVVIAGYLIYVITGNMDSWKSYGPGYERSPIYGIWNVEEFVRNGDTLAPLLTDNVRWKRLVADRDGRIYVYRMQDARSTFAAEIDTAAHALVANTYQDTTRYHMQYELVDTTSLTLRGVFQGDTLMVEMKYFDPRNFLLVNRGFNWVNEYPFNR